MLLDRRALLKGLGFSAAGLSIDACGLLAEGVDQTPATGDLPRSAPEAQGILSSAILEFLVTAAAKHEVHSIMLMRHGYVVAEGWSTPYRPDIVHSLYSLSKSFTSTAVGFAVAEGKLSVNDPIIHFFPDQLPESVSDNLAALRVEHLLTMSVGQSSDPINLMTKAEDWAKIFLSTPIDHTPGSTFLYSSAASYMLSAIVQKVTSQRIIDYLESRLFSPLNVREKQWERCPRGINTGGWGLSVTTESLAKFGQLYLQKGKWNGQELLPQKWVEAATTSQIQQPVSWNTPSYLGDYTDPEAALERVKKANDWYQGYGYQFWRCRHGAYRGDGAFGQFCIVIPDKGAVIAITSGTTDMQNILDLAWQLLLPAMHDKILPEPAAGAAQLKNALESMALPLPIGALASPTIGATTKLGFTLKANSLGAKKATFCFGIHSCAFTLESADGTSEVHCGIGSWVETVTDMPGTPPKFLTVADLRPVKVAAAGAWTDESTFVMQWRYNETPHHDIVTCRFSGGRVRIEFTSDITVATGGQVVDVRPVLHGHLIPATTGVNE